MESPREDADEVDEALNQMQKKISKQINRNASKAEEAQRERDKVSDPIDGSIKRRVRVTGEGRSQSTEGASVASADAREEERRARNPSHGRFTSV